MILNSRYKSDFNFLIAFFFINVIGIMLLLSAITFAFKIPLSAAHFPLTVLISIGFNYYASTKHYFVNDNKAFLKSTLIIIILFIISLLLAIYFYDVSADGQLYHQDTLILLKNGWNPFYQELPATVNYNLWINHYGKGAEIPQAIIYTFFNKIEAGKVTNIFLLIASFFLSASLLFRLNKFSRFKVYLISILLALNPVVIVQLFSYYIDLQLGILLLCLLITSCYFLLETDKYKLFLFAIIIIIALNIKFTAIPYAGIFIIGILGALLYKKNMAAFKKVFLLSAIATVIAIGFVGFNPYITNTVQHGHPFYPLAGKNKVDIMTSNSPVGFPERNRFTNLFISLFSHTDNISSGASKDTPKLKVPFTFKIAELRFSYEEDIRIGGFGVLFSGVVLLNITLLALIFLKLPKNTRHLLLFILVTILLSSFILEYAWWARYTPQLWFLPIIVLVFSELVDSKQVKLLRNINYIFLVINISLIGFVSVFKNLVATQNTRYQFAQLRTLKDTVKVDFNEHTSNRVKFKENNVPYIEHPTDTTGTIFVMKYIRAKAWLKAPPAKLPEPVIFKLNKFLKK